MNLIVHSRFETVATMDQAVANHIYNNADKLPESNRKILKVLSRHALKTPGVCRLKISTIAAEVGCSETTVNRAIKRLKELQILHVEQGTKLNGIQGANIYCILPFTGIVKERVLERKMTERATHEIPRSSKAEHVKIESESTNSFNLSLNPFVNNVIAYSAHDQSHDLKSRLRDIYQPMSPVANEAFEELSRIAFGRLKQYTRSHNVPYLQMEQIVLKAMHDLVRKQDVRNEPAMYSSMIKRQTEQLFEQFIAPKRQGIKVGVVPKWLKTEKERQQEQPQQKVEVVQQDDEAFLERKRKLEERMKIDNDVRAKLLQELGMN